MPKKSVFCIAQSDAQAIDIVQQLKAAGFHPQDISVLFPDKQGTRDFAHAHKTKAPEGAVAGAGTGGVLGGALGWLAGISGLAIPGLGPFVAAGPLLSALSGVAVGATVGGITGALVGMGMPEFEAKRYEGKIKSGNILISVHSDTNEAADKARTVFERAGAGDISTSSEAAVTSKAAAGGRQVATEGVEAKSRGRKAGAQTPTQMGTTPPPGGPASGSGRPRATPSPQTQSKAGGQPTQIEIAARAYQIYVGKGRPEGRDMENWLEAEAQLKSERRKSANVT
ncbi:MAG TPA: DUF2934 domain-containing protein [Verrucomicrobiae bacterium]|nr:DUF2934 domain-containing protein [Verrucomicrobiae bacterium]